VAFAPGAITNFFTVDYNSSSNPVGATGGGYILSKGTRSKATLVGGEGSRLAISVNGDVRYNARTTRRAVGLFLADKGPDFDTLTLEQEVETPIGAGFGASGSSATSAVYATASAAGVRMPKRGLALYAHRAEIAEQTGLGTVSVIYDHVGAGAIVTSGEPGKARFITVEVPRGTRIVTAALAPFDKKDALSSPTVSRRINTLGREALARFMLDPSLDSLASEGERFSNELGLESPEVKKLLRLAKSSGALHASQNMIGYAVHCVVNSDYSRKVFKALAEFSPEVRVDLFEIGRHRAGALKTIRR
jgi:pantoate kinase